MFEASKHALFSLSSSYFYPNFIDPHSERCERAQEAGDPPRLAMPNKMEVERVLQRPQSAKARCGRFRATHIRERVAGQHRCLARWRQNAFLARAVPRAV